jgi:hypothetical protein
MSTNLVVLFIFLVLFTGFFTLMSTFYYSTKVYKFSSTIYFSCAFYWVLRVDEYFLLFYECVFVVSIVLVGNISGQMDHVYTDVIGGCKIMETGYVHIIIQDF